MSNIDKAIFIRMNEIAADVGGKPRSVSESFNATIHPAYLNVNGLVTWAERRYRIGLNDDQPEYQYTFANWHENFHILDRHLLLPGFVNGDGVHLDTDTFSSDYMERMVIYTEKVCNLGAADQMIKTDDALMCMGYYALEEYMASRKEYFSLLQRFQSIQESLRYSNSTKLKCRVAEAEKELKKSYEKMMDLESNHSANDFMTISQVAMANSVPKHYVVYKLEALRIQGYEIDVQELVSYDKMFTKERPKAISGWY